MGIIFDIQRCSYHDGPGIRTTVFLKGCQLRCSWCHNPESFERSPQLRFIRRQCTGCRACEAVCPVHAHSFPNGRHSLDFASCTSCGACANVCPTRALTIIGRSVSAEEVIRTALRDRAYYEASGGGLTISGGEPTAQPEFLLELLSLAGDAGIHTCLETNGYIADSLLQKLINTVDLFLLDYKITGPRELYQYTHASGSLWENTLKTLDRHGAAVILRLPVIPGINDTIDHFRAAAAWKKAYPCIKKLEIMPYHSIGADKWEQLGYTYSLGKLPSVSPEQAAEWQRTLDALS